MKLNAARRREISNRNFAEPAERKYPIEDESHARNALSRVSQFGSPVEKSKVRSAVKNKYPGIGQK